MTAAVVIVIYLAIGAATAVLVLRASRKAGGEAPLGRAASALLLWPFTLPFVLGNRSRGPAPTPPSQAHTQAIEGRAERLEEALERARGAEPSIDLDRIARLADRLNARLRHLDSRLGDLEHAAIQATDSVRHPLELLKADSQRELEGGLRLMDELTGKLTLIAFTDLSGGGNAELDEVRDLLERLEAMASATREVAAVSA